MPWTVIVALDTMSVTVDLGGEVFLDATKSYDPDPGDAFIPFTSPAFVLTATSPLRFIWCLNSRPLTDGAASTSTGLLDVRRRPLLVVPQSTAGVPDQGYARLRPNVTGTYVVTITLTDGCNFVQKRMTINAVVNKCCAPKTAVVAAATVTLTGASSGTTATTTITPSNAGINTTNCLPAGYAMNVNGATSMGRAVWSPVGINAFGEQVNLNYTGVMPAANLPVTGATTQVLGCTWPGAIFYNPLANVDDGSCRCPAVALTWQLPDRTQLPNAYLRKVDPSVTMPAMRPFANGTSLVFYNGSVDMTTTTATCSRQVTTVTNNVTAYRYQFMTLPSGVHTATPATNRPSTSWGGYATVNYLATTTVSYNANNFKSYLTDTQVLQCTLSLATNATLGVGTTLSVSVPSGPSSAPPTPRQCLGYYTVSVTSNDSVCATYTDNVMVDVRCPARPTLQINADSNLLWLPGSASFVTNPSQPTAGVFVDTRLSVLSGTTTLSASYSGPSDAMYLGAGPTGPAANVTSLAGFPATISSAAPFYFRPSAPGTYTVTVVADDRCNTPVQESVAVTTQCVGFTCTSSVPYMDMNVNATNAATITLLPNASITQFAPNTQSAITPLGDYKSLLNWGFRLLSRPFLRYGDLLPGGAAFTIASSAGSPVSAECWLPANFNTQSPAALDSWNVSFTMNVALAGSGSQGYTLQASAMDGCVVQNVTLLSNLNVVCDPTLVVPAFVPPVFASPMGVNGTVKWTGNGWPVPTVYLDPALGALTSASTYTFSWFLIAAPSTYNSTVAVYNDTYRVPASALTCRQGGAASGAAQRTWDVTSTLRGVSSAGGLAPFAGAPSSAGAVTAMTFAPTVPGLYSLALQVNTKCSQQNNFGSLNAVCNNPARFICGDGSAQTNAPASCASPGVNANMVTPSKFRYSCNDNVYTPILISMLADGGSDIESASDSLVYTAAISSASPTSWWSAAFIYTTVTYTILVNNVQILSEDFLGFPQLVSSINGSFPAAMASAVNVPVSRIVLNNTGLPWARVTTASSSFASTLGVAVTAVGCYVPGYGRAFQVAVTFAVLPDPIFSTSAPVVSGSTDKRPLFVFSDVLVGAVNTTTSAYYTNIAAATGFPLFTSSPSASYPSNDPAPTTQLAPILSVAPAYFAKLSATLGVCARLFSWRCDAFVLS
jgi:hypothetical protein